MSQELIIKHIEAILFVSQKPLSLKKIAAIIDVSRKEIEEALEHLIEVYTKKDRGILLVRTQNDEVQFATNPSVSVCIQQYLKEDVMGELTRPALETLTVIAYRGPVRKTEIEQIRGVNCSLALRNLLIRGLVEVRDDKKLMNKFYTLSPECMNYFGIQTTKELPDYEKLNSHDILEALLKQSTNEVNG